MKKTYFKKLLVACVATVAITAMQISTVEAITLDTELANNIHEKNMQDSKDTKKSESKDAAVKQNAVKPNVTVKKSEPKKKTVSPAVQLSGQEKDLFARLVEAEAKGEPYAGKVAVATVVLNRMESPQFPDTVSGVIKQVVGGTYAFSPVQNGEIKKPASDEAKQAVNEALSRKNTLNNSLYFYNPEIATDDWIRSRKVVKTIGNHSFAK